MVAKCGLNNPDGKGATFSFSLPINDEDLRSTEILMLTSCKEAEKIEVWLKFMAMQTQ
jgi:hypothetical protein